MAEYTDGKELTEIPDKVAWAQGKMREFVAKADDWRVEAVEMYGLQAGDQWDDADKSALTEEGRPVFTFNRVAGFIRGICGLESSTRNQVRFYAREIQDSGASDVTNAAVKWVRESCDAEDEEADAFKDMLICGLGWTETLFTTEDDPEGMLKVERVDPLLMRWDTGSRKRGLADRRWNARIKYMPLSVIEDNWGRAKAREVQGMVEENSEYFDDMFSTPHDATQAREYEDDNPSNVRKKSGLPVVQFQYKKTATFYTVMNPMTGSIESISPEDYAIIKRRLGDQIAAKRVRKNQYRQLIYCGGVELEEQDLGITGFTFNPITGIRDRNTGNWYGFLRDMADPQRWINKFFSSMADVVASQAKGGLLAEVDAFVSKDRAAEEWADPRSIVWMKTGGLAKVRERASSGIPAGLSQLLEFTVGSLPHVAGVNLEFLGLAGREQAGVLETQRKQAAIATLSEFFNALRLYRKTQGRVLVQMIEEFISDGRLIRIVGKQGAQFVPLLRSPGTLQYDLVIDEAPDSPDQKGRTWEALVQILPTAAKMGFPIPPEIIQYAPFPQALIQDWMQFAQGEAGLPPEMKERIQQMQEQIQALTQENQQLKSKKEENMAQLQIKQADSQLDAQLEQQRLQADVAINEQRMQLERDKAAMQIQIEREKAAAAIQLEREKTNAQIELKRAEFAANVQMQQEQMRQQANQPQSGE